MLHTTYLCTGCPSDMLTTSDWILKIEKSHMPKVSPVLKFLNKNLLDGTLKSGKIKLEVFLNLKSKKKFQTWKMVTLPPKKNFFLPGGSGAGGIISWGGRVQNHFSDLTLFLIFNLKILPIWFCWVSRCHLKGFYSRILKQILFFDICDFSIFKI